MCYLLLVGKVGGIGRKSSGGRIEARTKLEGLIGTRSQLLQGLRRLGLVGRHHRRFPGTEEAYWNSGREG